LRRNGLIFAFGPADLETEVSVGYPEALKVAARRMGGFLALANSRPPFAPRKRQRRSQYNPDLGRLSGN
jgi:hypothetical protein